MIKPSVVSFLLLVTLGGCEDIDTETDNKATAPETTKNMAPVKPVPENLRRGLPREPLAEILTVADPTPPEEWLASVNRLSYGAEDESRAPYYRRLLNRIQPHVHEDRRMIANRSVQTSRTLRDNGIETSTDQILESFAEQLDDATDHYVYGELCAHYGNLRMQGIPHQQAVEILFQ